MPLTLEALAILDAIDRKGSFARAAEELGRAPSSLTYAVQHIEAELDALLFDRSGHRARFTPAGRLLLDEGRTLLGAAHALENKTRQAAGGWEPQFASGCADLALAGGDAPAGSGIRSRKLGCIEFVFCVAPQHPLAGRKKPLTQADIAAHRAVVIADTARNLPLRSAGWLQQQPRLTVADLPSKLAAQQAGLGVGSLPRWLAEREVAASRLVRCEWVGGNPRETLHLAWRSGEAGRALDWFMRALAKPDVFAGVLDAD
jgi:DNA-binding transcriptional LysR family regulator